MQIALDGPKTLTFAPQHLATILDCLSNAPFKVAQPIIESIFKQLQSEEKKTGEAQGTD